MNRIHRLLTRVHRDQRGAVSLETILIIGAIALPILIYMLKFGWPKIRDYFTDGHDRLEYTAEQVKDGQ